MNSEFFFEPSSKRSQRIPVRDESQARLSAWFIARKSSSRSWAGMTSVHAAPAVGFKKCCMPTGQYDGSRRKHYQR